MTERTETDTHAQDSSSQTSAASTIKNNTVKIAGLAQIMADTAMVTHGYLTKSADIAGIGFLGYTAGITGSIFGNPRIEKQLQLVERQLGNYLKAQGVAIPKDPTFANISQPNGVVHHAEQFLYSNPTQIMNACYGLMGPLFYRAGTQFKSLPLKLSGACMLAGALTGLLIHETHPDTNTPPQGLTEKAWSWVQEKPMRTAGIFFNINQGFLAFDAFRERKANPGKNAYMVKLLAVSCFVLCNTMLAFSSQSHGGGAQMDDATKEKLAEHAVRIIAAQPKEVQSQLLEQVSGFLATQPYIHLPASEISAMLHKKIDIITKNNPDILASAGQKLR